MESKNENEKVVIERIEKIENSLQRVEIKLDALLEKMEISVKECNKMGEHIDFIENVYETVKAPLSFICDKVNVFSGSDNNNLQNIEPVNHLLTDKDE